MYLVEKFEILAAGSSGFHEIREMLGREHLRLEVTCSSPLQFAVCIPVHRIERIARLLAFMGVRRIYGTRLETKPCPKRGVTPDDFYATTNSPTYVFISGHWVPVEKLRMDGVIVVRGARAICTLMRDVQQSDEVVVGSGGIRIAQVYMDAAASGETQGPADNFEFMSSAVSSERQVQVTISRVAAEMSQVRKHGGRIVFVAGPAVVHTGAMRAFCALVEQGYVQGLLTGNALAVHDIENAIFDTSLGINTETGLPVADGHRNHLAAINRVRLHGGIAASVACGEVKSGIMYTLVKNGVPFVLAGSIRDDGPLPDTEMDMIIAQRKYAELLEGCSMVVMVSSMLHSIGTGNMLPATCRMICVDINQAVVSKLADRGSTQAIGIVTDASLFLEALFRELVTFQRQEIRPAQGSVKVTAK